MQTSQFTFQFAQCQGTMDMKNPVFKKNLVESEVASIKIAFFPIFDPTWTHILVPTGSNIVFLRQNFNLQSLRRTEAILLPIYLTLGLTNLSKNLKNNSFLLFLTQNGRQKFSPNFLQMWYFLLFWSSISTQVFQ